MSEEILNELRTQKEGAKVMRNLGEFHEALGEFDDVIEKLEKELTEKDIDPEDAVKMRAELADTWGMKGGVYRRMENPTAALEAYKEGRKIEQEVGNSTYNLTNTITLSLTLGDASPTDSDTRDDLRTAIADLERETKGGRNDEWWAWSDLGQFYLLLAEPGEARRCYENAHKTGPARGEYKRHISILQELADACKQTAPEVAGHIEAAIEELARFT